MGQLFVTSYSVFTSLVTFVGHPSMAGESYVTTSGATTVFFVRHSQLYGGGMEAQK